LNFGQTGKDILRHNPDDQCQEATEECRQNHSNAATMMVLAIYKKGLQAGKYRTGPVNNKNRANGKTYGNQGFFIRGFNRPS